VGNSFSPESFSNSTIHFNAGIRRKKEKSQLRNFRVVHARVLFAAVLLLIPPAFSAQQQIDVPKIATELTDATRVWMDSKPTTPGVSGTLREKDRTSQDGRLKVAYNMVIEGAPKDQIYELIAWPINSRRPIEQMRGLSIGADGVVVCAGKTPDQCVGEKEDDPVNLALSPAPGEVARFALISTDQKTKVFLAVVPDPIASKSGTCSVEVIRLMPQFALAMVRARGYAANEHLVFSSKSYDEAHQDNMVADANGNFLSAFLPAVKGQKHGKTTLSVKGGSCTASTSFEWGE
jgi:hypothetical protein